jgi:hypothetical protein
MGIMAKKLRLKLKKKKYTFATLLHPYAEGTR